MQEALFTVAKLNDFVPADHPLRAIRVLVNQALAEMNARFNEIYAPSGRDSIAPEKLIRALLLQVFYSIRSERQLCEQLRYNLLFRWFVGLAIDDPIWDHSTFSKNRDRLLEHQVVEGFFAEVLRQELLVHTLCDRGEMCGIFREHIDLLDLRPTLVEQRATRKADDHRLIDVDVVVTDGIFHVFDNPDNCEILATHRQYLPDRLVGTKEINRQLLAHDHCVVIGDVIEELTGFDSDI